MAVDENSVSEPDVDDGIAVTANQVAKTYETRSGPVEALREVSFGIRNGEFISIVGQSGCGKSTLLNILAGLLPASGGTIEIYGERVVGPQVQAGIVFQNAALLGWRDALRNILLQAEARRLPIDDYRVRALKLLADVGLAGFEDKYPHELSGGMQQRVALCRALLHDPPLLFMDEPFGALDTLTRQQLVIDLQRICYTQKKTVFLVTHSVQEAVFLSDRVIVMTPRPGEIDKILTIDLARPRRWKIQNTRAFGTYTEQIFQLFAARGVLTEEDYGDTA